MAQSEALFLLLFNCSVFFLYRYFVKDDSWKNLLLFSIFAGLCFSTKLNGIMLFPIYLLFKICIPTLHRRVGHLRIITSILIPILLMSFIFIIINPYTYPAPYNKTIDMFTLREQTVTEQMDKYQVSLPHIIERMSFTIKSFINSSIGLTNLISGRLACQIFVFVIFIFGIMTECKRTIHKSIFSRFMLLLFAGSLIITIGYLKIAWPRYLIHLVSFVIYYEIAGVISLLDKFKKVTNLDIIRK